MLFVFQDQPGASTPSSLFHLAALLIKHGLVELDDLYLHVSFFILNNLNKYYELKEFMFTLLYLLYSTAQST